MDHAVDYSDPETDELLEHDEGPDADVYESPLEGTNSPQPEHSDAATEPAKKRAKLDDAEEVVQQDEPTAAEMRGKVTGKPVRQNKPAQKVDVTDDTEERHGKGKPARKTKAAPKQAKPRAASARGKAQGSKKEAVDAHSSEEEKEEASSPTEQPSPAQRSRRKESTSLTSEQRAFTEEQNLFIISEVLKCGVKADWEAIAGRFNDKFGFNKVVLYNHFRSRLRHRPEYKNKIRGGREE
ncbi:hypothetical protein BC832DRAFT_205247 [Gaertneriomyces semiglobifer]|nr:hypothetical protein BC832DRAFT_205247 [Gaertneriomyces semiglobifer]